jgi:predicted nucleotidyltransferase
MRRQSLSFVEIKSVDAAQVRRCADEYARRLLVTHPEAEEVIVFGSFADGTYAPGSDLDVFILLKEASEPVRERVPHFLPANFPVPMDVFPFTRAEIERLAGSPLLAAVARSDWRYPVCSPVEQPAPRVFRG